LDPLRLPRWYLDLLHDAIEPLRAEELTASATAARVAWADKNDYREFIRRLQRMAAPYVEEVPIKMAETTADQQLAAEFFKAQGIRVVGRDSEEDSE